MEVITVDNLCRKFTRTIRSKETVKSSFKKSRKYKEEFLAVNNISFKVERGDIFGILGPNGAGKTTLLRMLGGIMSPTSGNISLNGYRIKDNHHEYKKTIGYLSGNTKLYGRLSPRELLTIFGDLYDLDKKAILEKIGEIIELLDIDSFVDDRIDKLSTGQMQRVSIARCLIHSPELYIFDEPTLGLDVLSSHAIINFMLSESSQGKTVIYSTHYMEEAETICNKIMLVHKGNAIAFGMPENLKKATNTQNIREAFIKLIIERGENIE